MREGKNKKQHAEGVWKSDQLNRAKGVKGKISPCRVKGQRPLWGLGQRPNRFASNLLKGRSQQGAGSEASLPVTLRVLRRAPKLLIRPTVLCRAKWARPNCLSFRHSWSLSQAGDFASAEASRGRCGRPRHPFAAHTHVSWSLSLQGISRLRARVGGNENRRSLRSPPTPLRSAHPCGLTVIVGCGKRNCPPSAPQSFPHADAPDSQTAPSAPGTAARRPSARQIG